MTALLSLASPAIADDDKAKPKHGVSAPGTLVVDSTGAVVGNMCGPGCVSRQVGGVWIYFADRIGRDGLVAETLDLMPFEYTSSDCSGTAYLDISGLPAEAFLVSPVQQTFVTSATIYYPAPPFQKLPISSVLFPTGCVKFNPPGISDVGVATADPTPLTVVPPLSIK
jgi:hypothetical protein